MTPDTGPAPTPDVAPVACLGSIYGTAASIDPDNPDYEGDGFTKAEIAEKFTLAKQQNTQAYLAYKAALKHSDVLECAFCACGCAVQAINHLSASDCFKDFHGFT